MPRSQPRYAPEFRQQMIDAVRAGRTPVELAREFGVPSRSIAAWAVQAATFSSPAPRPARSQDERARLIRLVKRLAP